MIRYLPSLILLTFSAGLLAASFPYPKEWSDEEGGNLGEGKWDAKNFDQMGVKPSSDVPQISEWHWTAKPGEAIVISGEALSTNHDDTRGDDTKVWVMAEDGIPKQAKVLSVEVNSLTAIIPEDIPFGMYLVYVENSKGLGYPVPINRAIPEWIGPLGNTSLPGEKKRVFGRNLSENLGEQKSRVFLRSESSAALLELKVGTVEPYAVEFEIPTEIPPGKYKVYVHNGHGADFGLGGGVDLEVRGDPWKRGDKRIQLTPSGNDDTKLIQKAVNDLRNEANGGTILLGEGDFLITEPITITSRIRVMGMGSDKTRLLVALTKNVHSVILMRGNNIAVEDLSVHLQKTGYAPEHTLFGSHWQSGGTDDLTIRNLKWGSDAGMTEGAVGFFGNRIQVTGVQAERNIQIRGSSFWVHNNYFWGSPYSGANSEGGVSGLMNNSVIERNHFETREWPTDPNGSRQYRDFIPEDELKSRIWQKRLVSAFPFQNTYIAHNTSKDVATQDNRGEMILLHEIQGQWLGKVSRGSGDTLTLDESTEMKGITPGIFFDRKVVEFGGPIPKLKTKNLGFHDMAPYAVVVRGTGFGQARRIVAQNGSELKLDSPWRIQPAQDSLVTITPLYVGNIIYNNSLNAFPEGYRLEEHSASNGIQYDGNCWRNIAEKNVSNRTSSGRRIGARNICPSYWNEFRDEVARNVLRSGGIMILTGGSIISTASFANTFRGGSFEVLGDLEISAIVRVSPGFAFDGRVTGVPEHPISLDLANIIEGTTGSSQRLAILEQIKRNNGTHGITDPHFPITQTLYIRNQYQLTGPDPKPLSTSSHNSQIFVDTVFTDAAGQNISAEDSSPVETQ